MTQWNCLGVVLKESCWIFHINVIVFKPSRNTSLHPKLFDSSWFIQPPLLLPFLYAAAAETKSCSRFIMLCMEYWKKLLWMLSFGKHFLLLLSKLEFSYFVSRDMWLAGDLAASKLNPLAAGVPPYVLIFAKDRDNMWTVKWKHASHTLSQLKQGPAKRKGQWGGL